MDILELRRRYAEALEEMARMHGLLDQMRAGPAEQLGLTPEVQERAQNFAFRIESIADRGLPGLSERLFLTEVPPIAPDNVQYEFSDKFIDALADKVAERLRATESTS